ncbi:PREDICTED: 2-oxoglutarate and iron-dependent oxygenase domain-containing protein 3 [Nanorana parkeri]|uniref:2-oxoglutarate and iron-dependent oxygenase domain-containing protein 3 n=1 Tax=Nanorana parkeri TaxID=125878 RepID=UPI000854A60B|nr:PREDICTED: 2-oxoglutarate and iron-dependent oxygenase domain-containing protein 3 [Nanorana parkeri]
MATKSRRRPRVPGENGDPAGPNRGTVGGRPGNRKSRAHRTSWRSQALWGALCTLLAVSVFLFVWDYPGGDGMEVLAPQRETIQHKFFPIPCSQDYENHKRFSGCTPLKCGRAVTDNVISQREAKRLLRIAEAGFALGGSDGGASILDLHSGALSMGRNFVNMYRYYGEKIKEIITEEDFQLYRDVRLRIQQEIARTFDLDAHSLHLTKPTFFSRMNNSEAKTAHDEYWHPHIDKITYGSFDYTSLLYLSDYSQDFGGGRFIFMDEKMNSTVEPRTGRLSFFTSGSENVHRVEKVSWGTRYAITISFTCNPEHGIVDPTWT